MQEYINLYYIVTGTKRRDELETNMVDFDDIEIPEGYESSPIYSSNAKQAKQEINDYLINSSENEKLIHKLKEKIYSGDMVSVEYLEHFAKDNKFDCKICVNLSAQC
jgi:hypothetical protein